MKNTQNQRKINTPNSNNIDFNSGGFLNDNITNLNNNFNNFDSNYNNYNNQNKNNFRKLGEYRLRLMTKKSEIKIGKVNDNYNPERCLIEKEANSKLFKLTEKKFGDEKTKFTGSLMAEQTSKYLIFNAKANSEIIEIYPAENWYMFKKDINYKTINSDDAEEKMKIKSHIFDSLKNKGVHGGNASLKEKKTPKERKGLEETGAEARGFRRNIEEEDEEDNKFFKKSAKENIEEIEEKDDTDLELKEIPSDLEEDFFGKKKEDKVDLFGSNQDEEESSLRDDLSDMFEKSKENSEVEDDLSEVERKFNEQRAKGMFFVTNNITNF